MEDMFKKPKVPQRHFSSICSKLHAHNLAVYFYSHIKVLFFSLFFLNSDATKTTKHHYDIISANKAID